MTKERLFPLKVGADGQFALKEKAHKHINSEQTRIKVVFGLNAELRIIDPYLYMNGIFVDGHFLAQQKGQTVQDFLVDCKRENNAIFYGLNHITYICQQTVVKERGVVDKNSINLYIPVGVSKAGLVCKDVTLAFPRQTRVALADTCLNYTLSRL